MFFSGFQSLWFSTGRSLDSGMTVQQPQDSRTIPRREAAVGQMSRGHELLEAHSSVDGQTVGRPWVQITSFPMSERERGKRRGRGRERERERERESCSPSRNFAVLEKGLGFYR